MPHSKARPPNLLSCNFALTLNGDRFRREGREKIAITGS
jgi:hypothetical protein